MKRSLPRYASYRVLVNILYASYDWFVWDGSRLTIHQPRRWARLLSLETRKLKGYLAWLQEKGFLTELNTSSKVWHLEVNPPRM